MVFSDGLWCWSQIYKHHFLNMFRWSCAQERGALFLSEKTTKYTGVQAVFFKYTLSMESTFASCGKVCVTVCWCLHTAHASGSARWADRRLVGPKHGWLEVFTVCHRRKITSEKPQERPIYVLPKHTEWSDVLHRLLWRRWSSLKRGEIPLLCSGAMPLRHSPSATLAPSNRSGGFVR